MQIVELSTARKQFELLIGKSLPRFDPDAIDLCVPNLEWEPSLTRDVPDDIVFAKSIARFVHDEAAETFVITDASFGDAHGAFLMNVAEFPEFSSFHREKFGERVFSGGDVIIWMPAVRRIWVFHHEGVFATTQLATGPTLRS